MSMESEKMYERPDEEILQSRLAYTSERMDNLYLVRGQRSDAIGTMVVTAIEKTDSEEADLLQEKSSYQRD